MQFVPLVGTTLGRLGAAAVAMRWGLAHRAAEKAFLANLKGLDTVSPTTGTGSLQFLQLRSRFEHRNTARLSLGLWGAGGSLGLRLAASAVHHRADADILEALEVASSSRRRS
eukprot:921362-Rhodomonas_salina.2